jgi:hypothetical protein
MKKPLLIVAIILAVILVLPVINLLRWTFETKKPMGIIIVDKTVPTLERVKHKSLNWVLTNDRVVKKENKTAYSYRKDYYGFSPKRPLRSYLWDKKEYRLADLQDLWEKNDAIYLTDTYGVTSNDWYQSLYVSRRSRKLFGALNNNDNLLVKEMKDRNKLIICEYNCFDYPTADYDSYRMQERLGIKWSGWTGRYFSSLDTLGKGFPIWMTAMYRRQYKKPWTFAKQGIVLVQNKAIIVLEEGTQLKSSMPHIITDSANCANYKVPSEVAFDHWFDIIDPLENNIISSFKIETTPIGDSLLAEYGLTNQFPAAVQDPVQMRTYYFSGDFTDTNIPVWTSRFVGVEKMKFILYSSKPDDTRRFFWLYYKPLIEHIFSEYYSSLANK